MFGSVQYSKVMVQLPSIKKLIHSVGIFWNIGEIIMADSVRYVSFDAFLYMAVQPGIGAMNVYVHFQTGIGWLLSKWCKLLLEGEQLDEGLGVD